MKKTIFILVVLLHSFFATAQEYLVDFRRITTEDGLANMMTQSMAMDAQGYLWITNSYGVERYDGYSFNFFPTYEGASGIYDQIKVDDKGKLWQLKINSQQGMPVAKGIDKLDIFDPKTRVLASLEEQFGQSAPFAANEIVASKDNDPKNRMWITTVNGELYLHEKGEFRKIFQQEGAIFIYVKVDQQGQIWLATKRTLLCINKDGEILNSSSFSEDIYNFWVDENQTVSVVNMEIVWESDIQVYHHLSFWSKRKSDDAFSPFTNADFLIDHKITLGHWHYFIHRLQDGGWFFMNQNKIALYNPKGIKVFETNEKELGYESLMFTNYLIDDSNIWFTTPWGLVKIKIIPSKFQTFRTKRKSPGFRGITEDDAGNIYAITPFFERLNEETNGFDTISDRGGGYALIHFDSILWAGQRFNLKTGEETPKFAKIPPTDLGVIFTVLALDLPNEYLASVNGKLWSVNISTQNWKPFEYKNSPKDSLLQTSEVNYLYKNKRGIWAATNQGLFWLNDKQEVIAHFSKENSNLKSNFLMHIHEDEQQTFWMASRGGGILKWKVGADGMVEINEQLTTKNGLSNDFTYAVYPDEFGKLWIPSDDGLMCLNKKTLQLRTYNTEDGLPHHEFNRTSHYRAKDGRLYFGGLGGIIRFHPKDFATPVTNSTPLKFIKYSLLEKNKEQPTDKTELLTDKSSITIQPSDKFFELHFSLMDYEAPENHRFAYKIEGYDNRWQYIEENYLRITSLPYGTYTLKVKGKSGASGWTEQELALEVCILKPYYLRWWFISTMLFLLLASIFAFMQWRVRKLKKDREYLELEVIKRTEQIEKQAKELQEMDKTKTRFFANITHEFRTPLTLINGPIEQILKERPPLKIKEPLQSVLRNGQRLLQLINQLLDITKLENKKMKLEVSRGDLIEFTERLIGVFTPLAIQKEIKLTFAADVKAWDLHFDKDKWQKIVYNLLSNAIKFTPEQGKVTLSLKQGEQNRIYLTVKDTGQGISKENLPHIFDRFYQVNSTTTRKGEGTGIGLALVKELVEFQQGTIEVVSTLKEGTTFSIMLPIASHAQAVSTSSRLELIPVDHLYDGKAKTKEEPSTSKEVKKLELLIVEDNADMRTYIRSCINTHLYHITEAKDGEEGIQKALEIVPDLIISDIMMPKKDGYALTRTIRNHLSTSHIPLILLTAKASLESRLEGLRRGADAYLTKPFSPNELTLRIQKLIQLRQLLHKRYQNGQKIPENQEEEYQQEDDFMKELRAHITANIQDTNLKAGHISKVFGISRTQLYRKISSLTNQPLGDLIRYIRCEMAFDLIKEGKQTLTEIAYETGFSSLSHFSNTFKKVYGKSPSKIISKK